MMRVVSPLAVLSIVMALVACGGHSAQPPPDLPGPEDCAAPGDEDGNGLADCADPVCAATAACRPVCGNGKLEVGEACDDGNRTDGDGCDSDCTQSACGNGIVAGGEACDDGN
ncbi:MAG TPA: DUF4215 domain-containing protein, partial [Kofleriaceae bacterium]|nr:DUF4215 domain-containing protein [Kofleriaceae bacterium]